jgi:hypothetical protein
MSVLAFWVLTPYGPVERTQLFGERSASICNSARPRGVTTQKTIGDILKFLAHYTHRMLMCCI